MNKSRLILWVLIAWPLPALIAGAQGWHGIWGSGSALGDYLIPIPVAGGVLHLPSFLICGLIFFSMPTASLAALSKLRALLIGAAIAGLLWLLKLDAILLAMQTHSSLIGSVWQENPLGLFLLCDSLVALILTGSVINETWLKINFTTFLLILLPAALPISMAYQYSSVGKPFMEGVSRQGNSHNDELRMVYTSLDVYSSDFHTNAEVWANPKHPRYMVGIDDVAIMFTRNLDAARNFDTTQVLSTLCQYEDGTDSFWAYGDASENCLGQHQSFSEKYEKTYAARPAEEPQDLKGYMARKDVCVGVKPIPNSGETGGIELSEMQICSGLEELREKLKLKYPDIAVQFD
jgi:hypothetical protein